eukprot:6039956-Prymnesium_polylepis.1
MPFASSEILKYRVALHGMTAGSIREVQVMAANLGSDKDALGQLTPAKSPSALPTTCDGHRSSAPSALV